MYQGQVFSSSLNSLTLHWRCRQILPEIGIVFRKAVYIALVLQIDTTFVISK